MMSSVNLIAPKNMAGLLPGHRCASNPGLHVHEKDVPSVLAPASHETRAVALVFTRPLPMCLESDRPDGPSPAESHTVLV